MSESVDKCWDCGCTFIGDTPKHSFSCDQCGFEYVAYKGLWYSEDRAMEIQELKDFRRQVKFEALYMYCEEFFEGLTR